MIKIAMCAVIITASSAAAFAQDTSRSASPRAGTANEGNITNTGQTVPIPGGSKSEGTTSLDRGVQQKDNEIPGSVCKGC